MVKGVKLLLHLICAHDPHGQSVFGFLLLSSERRMFLCSVFRCSARRRLKVLRSSRQQNQHFIPFKSEDRKLKINLPLPRGGSLSFASGSFRRGMFLFVPWLLVGFFTRLSLSLSLFLVLGDCSTTKPRRDASQRRQQNR